MPSSGPDADQIAEQLDTTALPYAVVDVEPNILSFQRRPPELSLAAHLGTGSPATNLRIARGDIVSVSLWEAPPGTLFNSTILAGQAVNPSSMVTIPLQSVGDDGTIGIPFVGRLAVVGDTASTAEKKIISGLDRKAVQPQALVTVQRSPLNSVTVTGEVTGGARVPLSAGGERILDVIAAAGGLRAPVSESVVEVIRGTTTARAPFQLLVNNPRENIYVKPGDIVTVVREPRTFTMLGATGRNAEIPFDIWRISMAQAIAKGGGLNDVRADATGVFLFRFEPETVANRMLGNGQPGSEHQLVPTIYRFNLKQPHTMLTMSQFWVHPRDVIYVSNAPGAELQKFLNLLQGLLAPALNVAAVSVSAR